MQTIESDSTNLMGSVDVCFELGTQAQQDTGEAETVQEAFIEVQCKPVAFHDNIQIYKHFLISFFVKLSL